MELIEQFLLVNFQKQQQKKNSSGSSKNFDILLIWFKYERREKLRRKVEE